MIHRSVLAATLAALAFASPAAAQGADRQWFLRGGITQLTLADEIDLTVAGSEFPGTELNTKSHYTPTVQIGRFISPNFAVSLTVGLPPRININGAGTLEPFGKLAETTYGPATLTVQYRPLTTGTVQPYVGAGLAYMLVFDADDAAFQDVEIDDDLAPALEAGVDFMINDQYGIFIDAKKAFLRTEARGTFGGAPVVGNVKLDPWAFSAGVTFRF